MFGFGDQQPNHAPTEMKIGTEELILEESTEGQLLHAKFLPPPIGATCCLVWGENLKKATRKEPTGLILDI